MKKTTSIMTITKGCPIETYVNVSHVLQMCFILPRKQKGLCHNIGTT